MDNNIITTSLNNNNNKSLSSSSSLLLSNYNNNIGNNGSKKILKNLIKSNNPYNTISTLSNDLSLNFDRIIPALLLLENLGNNRSTIYHNIFNNIKNLLLLKLSKLNDNNLLLLLKNTFPFLIYNELKVIPLYILKNLKKIPNSYLLKLSEKDGPFLKELPLIIRQQVWQLNNICFINNINIYCNNILILSDITRLNEGHIKVLCEYIGTSENLFTSFANYCCKRFIDDNQPLWGSLLRQVLMGTQEGNNRIQSLGMLYELAWIIDSCKRQKKIEIKRFFDVIEKLKGLLIVQAFQISKRLNRPMVTEKRLGNIDNLLKSEKVNPKTSLIKDLILKPTKGQELKNKDHFIIVPADSPLTRSLKGAINYLVRMDDMKIFENRVDDSIAPGYSTVVKSPMEISTIKGKLSQYKSLDDLNNDVTLMFENCINYNGVESFYGMKAYEYLRKWNAKLKKEKGASGSDDTGSLSLQKGLEEALRFITGLDTKRYFAYKVTDEMAPDYSKEIQNPMDFGLIKRKLSTYNSLDSFDKDAQLVYNNCIHYNGIESNLGSIASDQKSKWLDKKENLMKRVIIDNSKPLPPVPLEEVESARKKPRTRDYGNEADFESITTVKKTDNSSALIETKASKISLTKGLDEAITFLSEIDTNRVFATKVTDEMAPGYSQIIKNPMDLGKIKKKLNRYVSLDEFDKDVVLVFDNCIKYNGTGSPYSNLAVDLKTKWSKKKDSLKLRISYDMNDQAVIISSQGSGDAPKIKLVLTLKKEAPLPAPETIVVPAIPAMPIRTKDLQEAITTFAIPANSLKKEAIRSAIEFSWFYLAELDKKGFFACPVSDLIAPGYSKIIDKPIDLSIIRVKIDRKTYKTIELFDDDVQLMLRNCFTYNNDSSQIYKDTVLFKDTWDAQLIAIKKVLDPHAAALRNDVVSTPSVDPPKKRMRYGSIMEPVKMLVSESSAPVIEEPVKMEVSESEAIPALQEISNNVTISQSMDINLAMSTSSAPIQKDAVVEAVSSRTDSALETIAENQKSKPTIGEKKKEDQQEKPKTAIKIAVKPKVNSQGPSVKVEENKDVTDFDEILYTNSINAAKVIQDKTKQFDRFPEILTEKKLLWGICMLRDSAVQSVLYECLGLHLASLEGKVISQPGSKKSYKEFTLPSDDSTSKLLLQICQLSFFNDFNIHVLDEEIIRHYIPLIMLYIAQVKDHANENDEEINVIDKSKYIVNTILSNEGKSNNDNKKKLLLVIAKILLSL